MKKTLYTLFSTLMLAVAIGLTPTFSHPVYANVTQSDINDQRLVVMDELIDVLREHVTLLQLVLIDKLEDRVAVLQALVEAQK